VPAPDQAPADTYTPPAGFQSYLAEAPTGTRNNYTGIVGYEIQCVNDMTVTALGRPLNGAMNDSHRLDIWSATTKTLAASATVTPDSPVDSLGFKVAKLDKPITLKAGEKYRIASRETSGGDAWYDITDPTQMRPSADARVTTSIYTNPNDTASYPLNTYDTNGIKGHVGVTLYYEVPAAQQPAPAPPAPAPVPPETPQDVRTAPVITLSGFAGMTLNNGQAYIESGYKATDCKGIDLTSQVKITNNVNIWTAGVYAVNYDVTDSAGMTARATRTVSVLPAPPAPPPPAPKITVNGSNPIILHSTSTTAYKEQSAKAVDYDGTDISNLVKISGTVNRTVAGTYTLTYSVTSPTSGLTATATRDVRIIAPTTTMPARTSYGLSGQAKQGASVTHTGIVANAAGFMDLNVASIDKNMTISAQLVDTTTNKAVLTDTFTAAGTKQYSIPQGKYNLVVGITQANGNSKYTVNLLMPQTAGTTTFAQEEVPLAGAPQIGIIGSNPIILHLGGTPYKEQGARASDFLGNDISGQVQVTGAPDTSKAGTYTITYKVTDMFGMTAQVTRDVRIVAPNDMGIFEEAEVPLADLPVLGSDTSYTVVNGDSLWKIAKKELGDGNKWYDIYDLNKDVIGNDPSYLKIGEILLLK